MVSKLFAIFLFSTTCFFANGAESSSTVDIGTTRFLLAKSSSKSSAPAHKPAKYFLPNFNVDSPEAKGLILKFHRWPNEKEKVVILEKIKKAGLKKGVEVQRFKIWTFEWGDKWHKGAEVQKLCEKFSGISSLKYCEPDYIVSPAVQKQETTTQGGTNYIMLRNWVNNRGLSIANAIGFLGRNNIQIQYVDNPEVPALIAAGKSYSPTIHAIPNTSENTKILEQFAQGRSLSSSQLPKVETSDAPPNPYTQPTIDPEAQEDLRSCNIVPSQAGFFGGQLSDYWGQELIGADLLKEELEKTTPIEKHLVEVFDSPERNHDVRVRNLISDEGKNAVLPELGDKAGITDTSSVSAMLKGADYFLNKADDVCSVSSQNSNQGSSNQKSSSQQRIFRQTASNGAQETTTHNGTEYIMLGAWSINRGLSIANAIGFLGRNNIQIQYVDNPHIVALVATGESYSPTIHAIPNTESNKTKLEQFAQQRGITVHNKNLTVVWKTATDWSEVWKSSDGTWKPNDRYDLEANYEMDRNQNLSILARREYRYIFRRPVLDMRGATSASTELFNWLPTIVLGPNNKLKIWGTREVANGPITINGVSVTLTEVPGTISDVPGSSIRHGRFEATLSSTDYNNILNNVGTSANSVSPQMQQMSRRSSASRRPTSSEITNSVNQVDTPDEAPNQVNKQNNVKSNLVQEIKTETEDIYAWVEDEKWKAVFEKHADSNYVENNLSWIKSTYFETRAELRKYEEDLELLNAGEFPEKHIERGYTNKIFYNKAITPGQHQDYWKRAYLTSMGGLIGNMIAGKTKQLNLFIKSLK